ncbi:MAG: M28 family peptidase [Candidatus Dormibacteraceae bacterium]
MSSTFTRPISSGGSDFRPFHELGIPCLFLSDFPNHPRHTTTDTANLVNPTVLARLVAVLASAKLDTALTHRPGGSSSPTRRMR